MYSAHSLLRMLSWSIVGLSVGCAKGSGGSSGGIHPPAAVGDPAVTDAARRVLENPGNPDAALEDLIAEMARLHDEAGDPVAADSLAKISLMNAIEAPSDVAAVEDNFATGGNLFVLPPPGSSGGSTADIDCPLNETNVYFINGVLTRQEDAARAAVLLQKLFFGQYPELLDRVRFQLYYNRSGTDDSSLTASTYNFLHDGTEWLAQVWDGVDGLFGDSEGEAVVAWESLRERCQQWGGSASDFIQSIGQWIDVMTGQQTLSPFSLFESVKFAEVLYQDVITGHKVVIVAHSQGNLFTDTALSLLPTDIRASIGVVGVASPTSYGESSIYGYFAPMLLK